MAKDVLTVTVKVRVADIEPVRQILLVFKDINRDERIPVEVRSEIAGKVMKILEELE